MNTYNNIWIIGCGDIGRRVAALYNSKPVHGIVSSKASQLLCCKQSIDTNILITLLIMQNYRAPLKLV